MCVCIFEGKAEKRREEGGLGMWGEDIAKMSLNFILHIQRN